MPCILCVSLRFSLRSHMSGLWVVTFASDSARTALFVCMVCKLKAGSKAFKAAAHASPHLTCAAYETL